MNEHPVRKNKTKRTDAGTDEQIDGMMTRRAEENIDGRMALRTDGRTDGRKNRWMKKLTTDGKVDGWKDGKNHRALLWMLL